MTGALESAAPSGVGSDRPMERLAPEEGRAARPEAARGPRGGEGARVTSPDLRSQPPHREGEGKDAVGTRGGGAADWAAEGALSDGEFSRAMAAVLPDLRAYAVSLAGSAIEGEDLLQDALVRIWRYRASFRQAASLRGWMFSVLRNERRSQRARRAPWIAEPDGAVPDGGACAPPQEWRLQWREVQAALARLPAANRQALLLVVATGCTYAEAAALCGCDLGQVKSRVHRARARLARMTGREDRPPGRGAEVRRGTPVRRPATPSQYGE